LKPGPEKKAKPEFLEKNENLADSEKGSMCTPTRTLAPFTSLGFPYFSLVIKIAP